MTHDTENPWPQAEPMFSETGGPLRQATLEDHFAAQLAPAVYSAACALALRQNRVVDDAEFARRCYKLAGVLIVERNRLIMMEEELAEEEAAAERRGES